MNELEEKGPIATSEQFKAALLATRDWSGISPTQLRMLQMQCRAPECAISPTQLAEELKLKGSAMARLHYGNFARSIAERLGYAPPKTAKGTPCWWFTLSTPRAAAGDANEAYADWIMRPELVAALRAMKWA
jgi:hypothetical protein